MGDQTRPNMKTFLLLSIVSIALVCAKLHGEDQYTEDAPLVAANNPVDETGDAPADEEPTDCEKKCEILRQREMEALKALKSLNRHDCQTFWPNDSRNDSDEALHDCNEFFSYDGCVRTYNDFARQCKDRLCNR